MDDDYGDDDYYDDGDYYGDDDDDDDDDTPSRRPQTGATLDTIRSLLGAGIVSQGLIMSTLLPWLSKKIQAHPKLSKTILCPLMAIAFVPALMNRLPRLWTYVMSYLRSSLIICGRDDSLQVCFRKWLEERKLSLLPERSLRAESRYTKMPFQSYNPPSSSREGIVIFGPRTNVQFFCHNKRLYIVTSQDEMLDRTDITIWTMGWSPAPIRNFLLEVSEQYKQSLKTSTQILVPDRGSNWKVQATRTQRPFDSVYLPSELKQKLIRNVEEYLSPGTRIWYADRGIPYRRGYLLHGSPGTGKPSAATALAGHFGMKIYSLSLLDPYLQDANLMWLLMVVDTGSLILLEDVDSARLGREIDGAQEGETAAKGKKGKETQPSNRRSGVTLSGLLNAIDGCSAPEGRVLLMTTNRPEALDEALTRPGRIDVKIEFKLADRTQIKRIFVAMYQSRDTGQHPSSEQENANPRTTEHKTNDVVVLADRFAEMVPEYKASPAQLQDYFLMYKHDAGAALENVEAWIRDELDESVINGEAEPA